MKFIFYDIKHVFKTKLHLKNKKGMPNHKKIILKWYVISSDLCLLLGMCSMCSLRHKIYINNEQIFNLFLYKRKKSSISF